MALPRLPRLAELPPELRRIHAMFRRLPGANENHGNIPRVTLFQYRIVIDVYFAESRAKLRQQRRNRSPGFVAEMATRTRIEGHITRPSSG